MKGGVRPCGGRVRHITQILSESEASVVALREIIVGDRTLLDLEDLKRFFPFESILAVEGEWTHGSSAALLSKSEIHARRVGRRVRAQSTTLSAGGGGLKLVNLYLSHLNEPTRTAEIIEVLNAFPSHERTLLCGDFNALSPQDTLTPSIIDDSTPRMREKYCQSGKLVFDTISRVFDAGYVDVGLYFHHPSEITGKTKVTGSEPSNTPPVRIDYFFASPPLLPELGGISMIKNSASPLASDHFPWAVDIMTPSCREEPSGGRICSV